MRNGSKKHFRLPLTIKATGLQKKNKFTKCVLMFNLRAAFLDTNAISFYSPVARATCLAGYMAGIVETLKRKTRTISFMTTVYTAWQSQIHKTKTLKTKTSNCASTCRTE